MGPATRYTLRRNTASIIRIWFLISFSIQYFHQMVFQKQIECCHSWLIASLFHADGSSLWSNGDASESVRAMASWPSIPEDGDYHPRSSHAGNFSPDSLGFVSSPFPPSRYVWYLNCDGIKQRVAVVFVLRICSMHARWYGWNPTPCLW